jgi:hypothetical protein
MHEPITITAAELQAAEEAPAPPAKRRPGRPRIHPEGAPQGPKKRRARPVLVHPASPEVRERWVAAAKAQGYKSLSAFMAAGAERLLTAAVAEQPPAT